ncbi:hypothetical protein QJS10_CPA03g00774 [Acorus calamus]|uniref:Uncharacterized protein n=1 Tax=Acorus calamus TaxID=4465 RepID=A0AAV9F5F2_ACOCL|nr:hypothetical protein QJS10_CPA03g00774 [Acorus calamus]
MEVRWAEKRWFLEGLLREVERKKEGLMSFHQIRRPLIAPHLPHRPTQSERDFVRLKEGREG